MMMSKIISVLLLVLLNFGLVQAEETILKVSWRDWQRAGRIANGKVISDPKTSFEYLRVSNPDGKAAVISILELKNPGISRSKYSWKGRVRFEGMVRTGYLEMWSFFPGNQQYFSRTLAQEGPMSGLRGSSDWRELILPFFNQEGAPAPQKLVLNLAFAGKGTVDLANFRLVQFAAEENPFMARGQWWNDRIGGWIGAIGGSTLGILGSLIGIFAYAGRARNLVIGLLWAIIVFGIVFISIGVIAMRASQPFPVYYPLLLTGGICVLVCYPFLRVTRKKYMEIELRKMRARDAGV